MKIVTWNCNGAFRNKFSRVEKYQADIYIIQECEDPKQIINPDDDFILFSKYNLWIGDNKNKGLGIFSSRHELSYINLDNMYRGRQLKYFLPFTINGNHNFLGVWAMKNNASCFAYIGQFYLYMQNNMEFFFDLIIAGDFNSNSRWDSWDKWWNHTDCINQLKLQGLYSVYHTFNNIEQGKEIEYTLFHRKNPSNGYHIDYIFGTKEMIDKTNFIKIEDFNEYKKHSDHVPLIWEYDK